MMTKRLDLKMPDELYFRVKRQAIAKDQSLGKTVRDLLDKELPIDEKAQIDCEVNNEI